MMVFGSSISCLLLAGFAPAPLPDVGNISAVAILGWYAWHTASRTIPQLVRQFREEMAETRAACDAQRLADREEMAGMWAEVVADQLAFREEIASEREQRHDDHRAIVAVLTELTNRLHPDPCRPGLDRTSSLEGLLMSIDASALDGHRIANLVKLVKAIGDALGQIDPGKIIDLIGKLAPLFQYIMPLLGAASVQAQDAGALSTALSVHQAAIEAEGLNFAGFAAVLSDVIAIIRAFQAGDLSTVLPLIQKLIADLQSLKTTAN